MIVQSFNHPGQSVILSASGEFIREGYVWDKPDSLHIKHLYDYKYVYIDKWIDKTRIKNSICGRRLYF